MAIIIFAESELQARAAIAEICSKPGFVDHLRLDAEDAQPGLRFIPDGTGHLVRMDTDNAPPAEPVIIDCKIGPYPKELWDPIPVVKVTFNDHTTKELFSFYPDELKFSEKEFIGLTEAEARKLRTDRDIAYLKS